ncbi:hypothetical protein HRH59_11355 [Rheinheimera sp. YQF-2]|uniref:Uncharacterized protein n=1 Tax=Rheinheimera lutimaris TaxID=2740584 RepID=A0A7Y5EI52_9GAMM|nr:hypothetical protein [Rheinheimera lutimaris]NRQ43139.1 hypothetical protein [Rheinheimera lutimaris]
MYNFLTDLNALNPETLKFLATVVKSIASLIGIVITAFLGKFLAGVWLSARDRQDKEVEWRNHAIELTKLDLDRKIKIRPEGSTKPLRPSILDFLANYRDLQELGEKSPKELYLKIERSRIIKPTAANSSPEAISQTRKTPAKLAPLLEALKSTFRL